MPDSNPTFNLLQLEQRPNCYDHLHSVEAAMTEALLSYHNSEAIGALARLACDADRQARKLQDQARQCENTYATATSAMRLSATSKDSHRELFQGMAMTSYRQAHQLQIEAMRLKRRYALCLEGIDRLNSFTTAACHD
jgi:hypothetical protein